MAGLALLTNTHPAAAHPRRPLRVRDAERDRAGRSRSACFHRRVLRMAPDPPPLRGRRLARVHGDRAVLAVRRACSSRSASASSTPTSSASPGSSTDARPRGRASATTGRVGGRRTRVLRPRRDRARRPPAGTSPTPTPTARGRARGAEGARVLERPTPPTRPRTGERADLVVPSPGVPPTTRRSSAALAAGVPVRSEIDLAAGALRARPDGPRSSRSPAPTARRRSPR